MADMSKLAKTPSKVGDVAAPSGQVTMPEDERRAKKFPVFDSTITFYDGGVYVDENKKAHPFKGGIKIKTPSMEHPTKISARALVGIYFVINDNPDIRDFLRSRVAEEKTLEKEL